MNGFHVDPGANWPWVARNSSGLSALAEYSRPSCLDVMPPTQTFGSYVGAPAIATTRPFLASITTTAPESATWFLCVTLSKVLRAVLIVCASCCSTTPCTRASIEVTSVSPGRPWTSPESPSTRPIESTATRL